MENLGILYDHFVYFTAIENMLWSFGIFCGHLVHFPRFGILYQEKSGNPVWRCGVVVIVSANRTEDRGLESRQGLRLLGLYTYIAMLLFET
jgi:hypothetical protein